MKGNIVKRKNKWKLEKGYWSPGEKGKTFNEIALILTKDEGKNVPASTVNNYFRRGLIKIANHISKEFDINIDVEKVCRDPDFRNGICNILNDNKDKFTL